MLIPMQSGFSMTFHHCHCGRDPESIFIENTEIITDQWKAVVQNITKNG